MTKNAKVGKEFFAKKVRSFGFLVIACVMVACGDGKNPMGSAGDPMPAMPAAKKGGAAVATTSGGGGNETAYSSDAGSGTFAGYNETDCPDYGIAEYALWAGKTNNAGSVTITSDDENLYVTYNTNGTADLKEVHVYVWDDLNDIPDKRPAPGQAPYKAEDIYADSYTVVIPGTNACGETLYVSTHAALVADATDGDDDDDGTGASSDGETAYAGGSNTPDGFENGKGAWWGYVTYTVDCYYDISGTVYLDADDSGDMESGETGFEGIEVALKDADGNTVATTTTDENGDYLFEHLPEGGDYSVEVVEGPAGHIARENAGGADLDPLSDCEKDVDFGYFPDGPVDPCDLDPQAPGCGGGGGEDFPSWAQAISHIILVFTVDSCPDCTGTDNDGYYTIKVDEWNDSGDRDLDNEIDAILAALEGEGLLVAGAYDLLGSSIKGGLQITSFYSYGSYNTNGEAADTPPTGIGITYDGTKANEGNQSSIDVVIDRSVLGLDN